MSNVKHRIAGTALALTILALAAVSLAANPTAAAPRGSCPPPRVYPPVTQPCGPAAQTHKARHRRHKPADLTSERTLPQLCFNPYTHVRVRCH